MMQHQIIDASMGLLHSGGEAIHLFDPLETYNATPFTPKPYDVSRNVADQHDTYRFGHTNNFGALASGLLGSSDTATDYIVGVCSAAMLIFGIALLWFMVIVGLKIAGQKKVGFLAGRLEHPELGAAPHDADEGPGTLPIIEEEPSTEAEIESLLESDATSPLILSTNIESDLKRAKKDKKFNRKVLAVRAAFVLSGIGVIISGALFYSKGVVAFQRSLDSFHGGIDLVQQTAYEAINLTETVINDQDALKTDFTRTKDEAGGSLCKGDGDLAGKINNATQEIQSDVEELGSMVTGILSGFGNDLRELITLTETVDNAMTSADIIFYVTISISIIIGVLIISMLVVTFFSARGVSNCCTKFTTNAILWPVFTFFLILFWIFALLFLVMSLAGSDFCIKPDVIVETTIRHFQDQFNSPIFEFLIYYVSGCSIVPDSADQFVDVSNQITDVLNTVNILSENLIDTDIGSLESQCGLDKAAASALQGGAELLQNTAHVLNNSWIQVRQLLECKTFNPIYTTFVHDAVCVQGVEGLTWLFSTSLFLTLFAMMMIMFRAALYPVKRPSERTDLGISFQ